MGNYRSTLKTADFLGADTPISVGKWVEIGERKIEAGVYYGIGFGFSNSQSDADGRVYCVFKDTAGAGAEVVGTLRIMAYSPDEMPIGSPLGEFPTSKLNSNAADLSKQLPFPILGNPTFLGQDYRFKLFFKADTIGNGTLSKTNSVISIDATKRSKMG